MRVLFVTGEFPPMQGGVGDCTYEIARALAARGVETSVFTSASQSRPALSDEQGVTVRRTVARWDWGVLPTLNRMLRETRADLVHIQYQTAAFGMHPAINLAPRLLGRVPWVVTFHDLRVPYLFPKAGPLREWVTFELARRCAAPVATNEEDWSRLEHRVRRPCALVPIGSNIAPTPPRDYERAEWRARRGIGPDQVLLAYFGFLNESKGGETLIRALALASEARLLMIGGQVGASDPTNLAYLERVMRLVRDLGLESRVAWTDYVPSEEVSAALLASDLCVLPYRDGASFRRGTLMAALAHGLPIITTHPALGVSMNSGRVPRLCDGENVLLVPPDQPPALAAAIRRLSADAALRARIARGARELSLSFTWDRIADLHIELYQKLLNGAARKPQTTPS